jgi:hypothetical protein
MIAPTPVRGEVCMTCYNSRPETWPWQQTTTFTGVNMASLDRTHDTLIPLIEQNRHPCISPSPDNCKYQHLVSFLCSRAFDVKPRNVNTVKRGEVNPGLWIHPSKMLATA